MAAGRFEEAIPLYSELVKAFPRNAGMRMNLAMAEYMAGHPRKAIPHFEAALKLQPKLAPAWQFLGAAHLQLGELAQAVEPLRKAVEAQPANKTARQMLADALLSLERFEQSAGQFRKLAEADPKHPKAWYGLGRSFEALSRRAFDDLQKTSSESPYLLLLMADALAKERKYSNAFYFFRQAAEKMQGLRDVHVALADIYQKTGHPDWAAVEEEKSRQIPPPDCGPQITRMSPGRAAVAPAFRKPECEFLAGRYQQVVALAKGRKTAESHYWLARAYNELALNAFSRLSQLPPSAETHELMAEIYRNQGRYADAVHELQDALKLSPENPGIQKELAEALYLNKDYQGAQALLEDLLKREPGSAALNFLYGDTLVQSQQLEEGIPLLKDAVRLDPKFLPAQAALGRAYLQIGQTGEAIPHLKAALEIDDDGSLHYQLARAYQSTGQQELAKQVLEKYQEIQKSAQAQKQKLEQEVRITPPL